MAIQMRRGNAANYDETKMLPGEFAVATDDKEVYIAFGAGDSKRVLTESDIQEVDNSLDAYSENPVQNKVLKSALDAKAPIASPTFTGTPKAPTAAAGTNNTQIATTAFVQQEINAIPSPVKKIWTGSCTTSHNTAAKVVVLNDSSGFSLVDGTVIAVNFKYGNDTIHPTLNVAGTGAKEIVYQTGATAGAIINEDVLYYKFGVGIKFFAYKSSVTLVGSDGYWVMMAPDTIAIKNLKEYKADLKSPTFTGTPLAPTAAAGTNNTQIATTAFVQNAISASAKSLSAADKGSGVVELSLT